jgi:hypothetical protein
MTPACRPHSGSKVHLRRLTQEGIPYYIANTGAHAGGMVLLKINGLEKGCRVLIQQRNLDGILGWADATKDAILDEKKADDYISRAVSARPRPLGHRNRGPPDAQSVR